MEIPDLPAAKRLEASLAEEQGWTLAFAERVGREYLEQKENTFLSR
jgi:hypothetical protein